MKISDQKYYKWFDPKINLDRVEFYKVIKRFIYSRFSEPVIIDIGCGQGFVTHHLNAIGFDSNKYVISLAKKLFPKTIFYLINANDINLKKMNLRKANIVICFNLIEHMEDKDRNDFMSRVIPSILENNGWIIFSLYRQFNIVNMINMYLQRGVFYDPTHIYNWTIKEFKTEVSKYFKILKLINLAGYTKLIPITKYLKSETVIFAQLK